MTNKINRKFSKEQQIKMFENMSKEEAQKFMNEYYPGRNEVIGTYTIASKSNKTLYHAGIFTKGTYIDKEHIVISFSYNIVGADCGMHIGTDEFSKIRLF